MQHCKVFASQCPVLEPQEEVIAGDEWIRYQELELTEDDLKLKRVDHFWYKVFSKVDTVGEQFAILPKMVKCALSLCHSNADVEMSLSSNKRVLTKQKSISD